LHIFMAIPAKASNKRTNDISISFKSMMQR
ncbi:MAG: hypothetical protein ACI9V9_001178, partial [Oleispira sp.]